MEPGKPGTAAVEECKTGKDCSLGKVKDTSADWIVREKAAIEVMRAAPG